MGLFKDEERVRSLSYFPASPSSKILATFLSRGLLLLPHLGDCTRPSGMRVFTSAQFLIFHLNQFLSGRSILLGYLETRVLFVKVHWVLVPSNLFLGDQYP